MTRSAERAVLYGTLGACGAAIAVFLAAPRGGAWQLGAWCVPLLLATVLLARRFATAPRAARGLLGVLVTGALCYLAASVVWLLVPLALGVALPFPSPVDGLYFVAYGYYAGFLMLLLRQHRADRVTNRIAALDALILTTAASAVLWIEVIAPQLRSDASAVVATAAILYPVFTLALLGLAVRVTVALGRLRSFPGLMVIVWIAAEVAADATYGVQSANGTFAFDRWLMVAWMVSYAALAVFAAHPRTIDLLVGKDEGAPPIPGPTRGPSAWVGRVHLGVLLIAALFPLVLHSVYFDDSPSLLVASGVTFVLVLYRTALLAGDLIARQRQAAELCDAVERLGRQREELARYAAIVNSTDDAVVTTSLDGVVSDWNAGAERLYGYPRGEAIGRPIRMLEAAGTPWDLDATPAGTERRPRSFETVAFRRDGSPVEVSISVSTVCCDAGDATAFVLIARDIGDRKAREAELNQESKLESLGRLAAGLAHEINSPIQFVGDNARFLAEAYEELMAVVTFYRSLMDTSNPIGWNERQERMREAEARIDFDYLQEEIPSAVEQTLEGIRRVSTIVRAMKTFSHQGHQEHVPADLSEALEATVTVTRHQVSSVADLRLELSDIPPVRCNIADLNQVFLNLIVNAADAVAETGAPGIIGIETHLDDDHAVIRISDTGAGIPDDVRPKIFDPFFTTKEVGRGSGQGLPLARSVVVEGHGGTLSVDSTVGVGSTFTIRLPIAGRAATGVAEGVLAGSAV